MDQDELAARAAIACWRGAEGTLSREIRDVSPLSSATMKRWLGRMGLARFVPTKSREGLLAFLNEVAIPKLRTVPDDCTVAFSAVERLSEEILTRNILKGRPTSLLSKLGMALRPELFIPYDKRVRRALKNAGRKVREHCYSDYMAAVMSEKPAFLEVLKMKNLSINSLGAEGLMSQSLFELRGLDKRLMLKGKFSPDRMARDLRSAICGREAAQGHAGRV